MAGFGDRHAPEILIVITGMCTQPRAAIDQRTLRRDIDCALRAVDPMSWRGPDAPDQLEPFIVRARALLAGGDAAAALAIGEAVATPLAERYEAAACGVRDRGVRKQRTGAGRWLGA